MGHVPPRPAGTRTGKRPDGKPDPETSPPRALLCSLALPAPPGKVLCFHGPHLPKGILQALLASCICLVTVRPLHSLPSSCQRWDGHAPGKGSASLCQAVLFPSCPRPADCAEIHHEGHGASPPDRLAALFCYPHVCHHRPGVLQREAAPSLLHKQFRWGEGLCTHLASLGRKTAGLSACGHCRKPRAEKILHFASCTPGITWLRSGCPSFLREQFGCSQR